MPCVCVFGVFKQIPSTNVCVRTFWKRYFFVVKYKVRYFSLRQLTTDIYGLNSTPVVDVFNQFANLTSKYDSWHMCANLLCMCKQKPHHHKCQKSQMKIGKSFIYYETVISCIMLPFSVVCSCNKSLRGTIVACLKQQAEPTEFLKFTLYR